MTERDFCYWLNGFVELHGLTPDPEQWAMIKEHLALVFTKVTGEPAQPATEWLPYVPYEPQLRQEWPTPSPTYCATTPMPGEAMTTGTPDDFIRHNATVGGCAGGCVSAASAPVQEVVFDGQAIMDMSEVPPRMNHVDNKPLTTGVTPGTVTIRNRNRTMNNTGVPQWKMATRVC